LKNDNGLQNLLSIKGAFLHRDALPPFRNVGVFLLIIFLYLYDMEQFTIAELYGKTLELQHENEQLKNQLILKLKNNE